MSLQARRHGYGSWPLSGGTIRIHWHPASIGTSNLRRAQHLSRQTRSRHSTSLRKAFPPLPLFVTPHSSLPLRQYRSFSSSSSSSRNMASNDAGPSTLTLPYISSPIPAPLLYYEGNPQYPTSAHADSQLGPHPIINPSTSESLTTFNYAAPSDIDAAISSASRAFPRWRATPAPQRARILFKAAAIIRERADDLARLETIDTGRPVSETGSVDVPSGAEVLEYYAGFVASGGLNGETIRLRQGAEGDAWVYRMKEPLGACAAIGAWNYPLQMYVLNYLSRPYGLQNYTSHANKRCFTRKRFCFGYWSSGFVILLICD